MSQYIQFYIKGIDSFYPIATFSRSNKVYEIFREEGAVPFEKLAPITNKQLGWVYDDCRNRIEAVNKTIANYKEKIARIDKWDAPISDKIDAIDTYKEYIEEEEETLRELETVRGFAAFIYGLIEEADGTKYESDIETLNPDTYVWAGIEVEYPNIEDYEGTEEK